MISPLAHIDPQAKIGHDVTIYPFACIDKDVTIGPGSVIMSFASVCRGTTVGAKCRIHQGAIVGADPQDFRWKGQPSTLTLGDNVTVRENVIINRGFLTPQGTQIDTDTAIMANAHIGHDSHLGQGVVIGNNAAIAGNVTIGPHTILSSAAVAHESSRIGPWTLIKGGCRIAGNVPPYAILAHNPAAYFGVNAVIMSRCGFTPQQIDDIAKCYRYIYQAGTSVFNALHRIEADVAPSDVRDTITSFVRDADLSLVAIPKNLE